MTRDEIIEKVKLNIIQIPLPKVPYGTYVTVDWSTEIPPSVNLTRHGKEYLNTKRRAGLNHYNTKRLTKKEIEYVENKLNFELMVWEV